MQRKIGIVFFKKFKVAWDGLRVSLDRRPLLNEIATELNESEDSERLSDCIDFVTQENSIEIEPEKFEIEIRQTITNYELKKARIKAGMTQDELNEAIKAPVQFIGRLETFRVMPNELCITELSRVFGFDAHRLFPDWVSLLVENRNTKRSSMIVEVGRLALDHPEVLQLEEPQDDHLTRQLDGEILKKKLKPFLEKLPPREYAILKYRYGLDNNAAMTLEETAQEFGVTRERIRQIEARAMQSIKDFAEEESADLKSWI